jgi:hypothetical protein
VIYFVDGIDGSAQSSRSLPDRAYHNASPK